MRGIVFTAGGPVYFLNAYLNCALLRDMGCDLSIEWFFCGDELRPYWIRAIETLPDVKLVDLGGTGVKTRELGGWQSKIKAIIQSSFDEIMFIDADSFPCRDPQYLFDHLQTAVFWPDAILWKPEQKLTVESYYNIKITHEYQIESGQMMFRKSECMDGLERVQELNEKSDITYKHVYGDKDTFYIGFKQANVPFQIVPFPSYVLDLMILQRDFFGRPLFFHTAGNPKWSLSRGSPSYYFPRVKRATEIVHNLCEMLKEWKVQDAEYELL